jgi:hypothetical protein
MHFTARQHFLFAWILLGSVAAAVCSLTWPAAHLGSEILPVGNDSFYHARRILDTVKDPSAFYEFDAHIHAPEGSLLVWPWGYDYAMAWIVRIGMQLGLAQEPIGILVWIPVVAVFLSVGLIMLIARRLGLSLWSCSLAALCVAISPLTQTLHGAGFVDHHFAEYIFVLATIALGLKWFGELSNPRAAAALGVVLGLAPAIHNAMFILQLPVLACLFILWMQGVRASQQATMHFSAALLISTALILIPSQPVHEGMFAYYLLSWFQLYVAAGTVACCCWFSSRERSPGSLSLLGVFAVLTLLPLAYQIMLAKSFLTGNLTRLDSISEMFSVPKLILLFGAEDAASRYSHLLWLLPLTFILCAFKGWQQRRSGQLFFWICALCGLPLLFMQYRLHYFGSFALCIPWLMVAESLAAGRLARASRPLMLATTLLIVLAYIPALRHQLLGPIPVANDQYFIDTRPVLKQLAAACEADPGVVLADHDIGHHIRYLTNCDVIANNFLLTEQQGAKIMEMERLFKMSATDLLTTAPYIKYVLVRPVYIEESEQGLVFVSYSTGGSDLVADLLLRPAASAAVAPPAEYHLLHQSRMVRQGTDIPYARLYKIQRTATVANVASPPRGPGSALTTSDKARH